MILLLTFTTIIFSIIILLLLVGFISELKNNEKLIKQNDISSSFLRTYKENEVLRNNKTIKVK